MFGNQVFASMIQSFASMLHLIYIDALCLCCK